MHYRSRIQIECRGPYLRGRVTLDALFFQVGVETLCVVQADVVGDLIAVVWTGGRNCRKRNKRGKGDGVATIT
jgi:hypothetical protein